VSERGDRALIGKFEGKDLTHPWAANVIDLCPVGALLSKDFLNKARAWELDRAASICPNCTQGCNITVETRDDSVVRFKPRPNEDVNKHFMCDYGRLNYRWVNRQDRAEMPMVRANGVLAATEWETAITAASEIISGKNVHVIASPMLSNEALFLLSELIEHNGGRGVFRVATGDEAPLPGVEDLALRRDRAANVVGAEMLGYRRTENPLEGLGSGDVLIVADDDLEGLSIETAALPANVVVIGTSVPRAIASPSAVLPITNFAEEEGTFTNLRGRVQRFTQAKAAPGMARPSWLVLGDLLGAMGAQTQFFLPSEVFANMAAEKSHFAGMSYDTLGMRGLPVLQGAGAA
jgi:NADH-quinone oxidoreductase subunit G